MEKIDFKKELKNLFQPPKNKVTVVNVPAMNFVMTDGEGDPNTSEIFQNAVEALYSVSYSIKFALKRSESDNAQKDYVVPPLEGLWWCSDMNHFMQNIRADWKWTLMIMQPDFVTIEDFTNALDEVKKKKPLAILDKLRFEKYEEGVSAQIMHIGPYSAEGPVVEKLHEFIKDNGFFLSGKHHEIYLSDPRKSDPLRMRTVIRQPFKVL